MPTLVPKPGGREEAAPSGWWGQLTDQLALEGRLSPGALQELVRLSQAVFKGIPRVDAPQWRQRRVLSGMLVGGVQAGKTTAMMAVAARALDSGFRIIVVLAGLRDDLRRQTALRFGKSLLARGERIYTLGAGRWQPTKPPAYSHAKGRGLHGSMQTCWAASYLTDCNQDDSFVAGFREALVAGNAVLSVVKKNTRSLERLGVAIHGAVADVGASSLPMLVLDDECDEASVGTDESAPTPDAIARLWAHAELPTVYVGVTATPAASLLQSRQGSLFPTDFGVVLRVPGAEDSPSCFFEGQWSKRYTGGRVFFQALEDAGCKNFLLETSMTDAEASGAGDVTTELEEALIAYFVGGAMRLLEERGGGAPHAPGSKLFPHTMLIHTDSEIDQHWNLCRRVSYLCNRHCASETSASVDPRRLPPEARLIPQGLEAWLCRDEPRWSAWADRFRSSKLAVKQLSPESEQADCPDWALVRQHLIEVFSVTKLRVLNSDEGSAEPPLDFFGSYRDGAEQQPYDAFSIIIGGNRLSRGLTIEGLCISYFTRGAGVVAEDTATQRERWFGYRGAFLAYVRVFCHRTMAWSLARFFLHEEDVRDQLVSLLETGATPGDANYRFLRLAHSVPTSKLNASSCGALSLSGTRVFLDVVESSVEPVVVAIASHNLSTSRELVSEVLADGAPRMVVGAKTPIGYLLREQPASRVVEYLDAMQFSFHNPDPAKGARSNIARWHRSLDAGRPATDDRVSAGADPYLLAAYLRYWGWAYTASVGRPHLDPHLSSVDCRLGWRPCPAPVFNIGVRFGRLPSRKDFHAGVPLVDRQVTPSGDVLATWGGRGSGGPYAGDPWFDSVDGHEAMRVRATGSPGLLLLYVIARQAIGIGGGGAAYPVERPVFGCVVPAGGPNILYAQSMEATR